MNLKYVMELDSWSLTKCEAQLMPWFSGIMSVFADCWHNDTFHSLVEFQLYMLYLKK
jgi:hypothetical protein